MVNEHVRVFPMMLIRTAGLPSSCLNELSGSWPEEKISETEQSLIVRRCFDDLLAVLDQSGFRTAVYNARKDFFNRQKIPPDAFLGLLDGHPNIRAADELLRQIGLWKELQDQKDNWRKCYDEIMQENLHAVQKAAQTETLQRALLFASHDLLDRLPSFCQRPVGDFHKKDRQTALALLKYLTRAAAKTSPLSRFTTLSFRRLSPETPGDTEIPLFSKSAVIPNVALLPAIYEILLRQPAFYRSLAVILNPCISPDQRNTWLFFDGERESFQHLAENPVAGFVVQTMLTNDRKMRFTALVDLLQKTVEAGPEQLQSLVFELIDIGLLEWELPEKGMTPGWCGGLYNYLGFLSPQLPVIVETAALLQWLRTSARSLPFQSVAEAQAVQRQTAVMISDFFDRFGAAAPPIPPEQIFFEDVCEEVELDLPASVVRQTANDLSECWRALPASKLSGLHAGIIACGLEELKEGESVDFLAFSRKILDRKNPESPSIRLAVSRGKMGALLQFYKLENGEFGAVVNGIFPGGGKLFARWLHLFPPEFQQSLEGWNDALPFPWQGWSNANFQPVLSDDTLTVPDGRVTGKRHGKLIALGNVLVSRQSNALQLVDRESNSVIRLNDLGLEVAELRPPAMQILHALGVPFFSMQAITQAQPGWQTGGEGWRFRARATYRSLVLLRASWEIDVSILTAWRDIPGDPDFFRSVRSDLSGMGIPGRFFARFYGAKPQYFDQDSPILFSLFKKMLKQTDKSLLITEMLPVPEQYVAQKDGACATELVIEFEV